MIKKVVTIGSDSRCDFIINRSTYPTLMDCIIERINPIHAQIIQDDENFYLIPFSDYIYVNEIGIMSFAFQQMVEKGNVRVVNNSICLDVEDEISCGIDIYWQQWMAGLGLSCDKCEYQKHQLQNDEWCKVCKGSNYNPLPYINGFSREFKCGEHAAFGFKAYPGCENCSLKPGWCVECVNPHEPQSKIRTYKEHVEMYVQRLRCLKNSHAVYELCEGYVDLGLPSGTLWKDKNESDDYYTYDRASRLYGSKLPSKEQWEELKKHCGWVWNGSEYKVTGQNGSSIILPALGYSEGDYGGISVLGKSSYGYYWTSTPYGSGDAWYLGFDAGEVRMGCWALWEGDMFPVRLVQN